MKRIGFFSKMPGNFSYYTFEILSNAWKRVQRGELGAGEEVKAFEREFSVYVGAETAIALPLARIGCYLSLKNLNLPEGSEVLMTPVNIPDMVNMVCCAGLKPRFVDMELQTYNIDLELAEQEVNEKTKVLFLTHLYGIVPDMDAILAFAGKHNLIVIEDASQAIGATYKGKKLGTFGLLGLYSLGSFKTLNSFMGATLTTNDLGLAEKVRQELKERCTMPQAKFFKTLILKGFLLEILNNRFVYSVSYHYIIRILNLIDPSLHYKFQTGNISLMLGLEKVKKLKEVPKEMFFNFTDFQAEIARKLLKTLDADDDKRLALVNSYYDALHPELRDRLPLRLPETRSVFWRLPIIVGNVNGFKDFLLENYIDTTNTMLPINSQEDAFREFHAETPEAEKNHNALTLLPLHKCMSSDEVVEIAHAINRYFGKGE